MIRDPSDGSIRDASKPEVGIPATKPPEPTKDQLRMERSRQWLREYHARKNYPQNSEQNVVSGLPD
jgi:hypothetical protein